MKQHYALMYAGILATCAVVAAVGFSGCANAAKAKSSTPGSVTLHAVDTTLNESGTAVFEATDPDAKKTTITINLNNEPKGERQYAFMIYGSCNNNFYGQVLYPLNDVTDGSSVTDYHVSLMDLADKGPADSGGWPDGGGASPGLPPNGYAVTVYRYTTSQKTLAACGNVPLRP